VIRELAIALTQLAVALNRQTQAMLELAEQTRQLVQSVSESAAAAETGASGSNSEDQDHLPTHGLDGQPIIYR
jgi:hypothetical protein